MKPILFSLALLVMTLPGLAQSRGTLQYDSATLRLTPRNALASNVFGAGGINASADENGGLTLDGSAFVQPTKRVFYGLRPVSATSFSLFGLPALTGTGSASSIAPSVTNLFANYYFSTVSNSLAGWNGGDAYLFHAGLDLRAYFWSWPTYPLASGARLWIGFSSTNLTTFLRTDEPAAYHVAAFRYSYCPGEGNTNDANYICVTADGTGVTYTDSGVAPTTNRTQFAICSDHATGKIFFFINGACVATNTSNLPTARMQVMAGICNLSTSTKAIRTEQAWIDQLIP